VMSRLGPCRHRRTVGSRSSCRGYPPTRGLSWCFGRERSQRAPAVACDCPQYDVLFVEPSVEAWGSSRRAAHVPLPP
jgi:hypothetical protein